MATALLLPRFPSFNFRVPGGSFAAVGRGASLWGRSEARLKIRRAHPPASGLYVCSRRLPGPRLVTRLPATPLRQGTTASRCDMRAAERTGRHIRSCITQIDGRPLVAHV